MENNMFEKFKKMASEMKLNEQIVETDGKKPTVNSELFKELLEKAKKSAKEKNVNIKTNPNPNAKKLFSEMLERAKEMKNKIDEEKENNENEATNEGNSNV